MKVRELTIEDYGEVISLWQSCDGIGLHSFETENWLAIYLSRNPGLSFVAIECDRIIGAVLCGHDGRRGYMNHLAVADGYRGRGVGKALVARITQRLSQLGIRGCNGLVYSHNKAAHNFYNSLGWALRDNLTVVSKQLVL